MSESQPTAHAQSQPDDHPAIQEFLSWVAAPATRRSGCGGSNNDTVCEYISWRTLKHRLNRGKVEELLEALFKDCEYTPPEADYVTKHYLRAFAILLCAGQGRMIHHFCEYQTLQDRLLPFLVEPSTFPKSTGRDIFADFRREQWAFCAVRLEYDVRSHLESEEILPITHIERIEEGGSAIAYKIKVDPDYDELVPATEEGLDALEQHCHTYVIKTYRSQEAQAYYKTERSAFEKLRYNGLPTVNIIGFYGSFVRQQTYNIILEYADLGTLDEYMERTSPPSSAEDKMRFWERFLEVAHGLATIHGEDEHMGDGPQILLGWHQDVNPSNILVKSRRIKSPYDCHFKLADLGLSHFKKHTSPLRDATDVDTWGTNAYGAPETRRTNVNLEKSKLKVRQDVDIWSMGCVYSEVATWVDQGWNKVVEYRRRRSEEIKEKTTRNEDSFHDGLAVLDAVRQIHYDIVQYHRGNDFVTPKVVNRLVNEMLLVRTARPDARYLYDKSRRIIDDAHMELKMEPSYPISLANVRRPPVELNSLAYGYRLPPENGPGSGATLPGVSSLNTNPGFSGIAPQRGLNSAPNGGGVPSTSSQDHPDHTHQYSRSDTAITYPTIVQMENEYNHRHPDHNVDYPYRVPNQTGGHQCCSLEANEPSPHLPIRSGTWTRPADKSTNTGKAFDQSGNQQQSNPTSSHSTSTNSPQGCSQGVSESTTPKFETAGFAEGGNSSLVDNSHGNQDPGPDAPRMTVEEGLAVKQQKEHGKEARFPPEDQDLFESLRQRDHAFLIDNSKSMEVYRPQVRKVLELLSYMLGPTDPDGLDMYFTTHPKKLKPGNSYAMLTEFDKRHATRFSDIRQRFANILEDYQKRFGKRNVFSRLRHPNSTPSKGPRKYTLYVLTDGAWHQSVTLTDEMRTLVKHLTDHNIPNKHIGIQFIRFGNDPQGIRRLKRLDSKRRLGVARDLVDTEPANGNVWKMLLGPLNPVFDNDTEDEYDEDDDDDNDNDNDYMDEKGLRIKGLGSQKGKGKRQRSGTQRSDQIATR